MSGRRKLGLLSALLVAGICCPAQQNLREIRLTIKYNGRVVPNPTNITLTSDGHVVQVRVQNDKFTIPIEISQAKVWNFTAAVRNSRIQLHNLSQREMAYEDWTLLLADRRYTGTHSSEFPKGADVRSSCVLILESRHIDPGLVISQTHCRTQT